MTETPTKYNPPKVNPPDGWTLSGSADGTRVTLLRGPEDDQRSIVIHCSERGRWLTVGAADDEGRTTISVDLEAVIAALVHMNRIQRPASTSYTPPRYDDIFAAGVAALDEAE
jgi:hypothetical protein